MALDWGVNILRLSLFSSEPVAVSDRDWKLLTGEDEAEARHAIPGGKRLSGKVAGGTLSVTAHAGRVDFVLSPYIPAGGDDDAKVTLPIIGEWDTVRDKFIKFTSSWLDTSPFKFSRIAFGAIIISQMEDQKETYKVLRSLLKSVNVDPEKMRDLLYRINWPQRSTIAKAEINRLTTWSGMKVVRRMLALTGAELATGEGDEIHALRLEIDHNTEEGRKEPFDANELIPIYNELVELACQNAAQGERP